MRPAKLALSAVAFLAIAIYLAPLSLAQQRTPECGDKASEFKTKDLNGNAFEFQPTKQSDWTVLVFLRGYPGYQCPLCTRQVGDLIAKADDFAAAKANVVFVYPGTVKDLTNKAQEFVASSPLPTGYQLVIDPDYKIVNDYKVRWDAPRETAFPSTFVIDPTGFIRFAKVSKTHGDRTTAKEILSVIGSDSAPVKIDPKKQ